MDDTTVVAESPTQNSTKAQSRFAMVRMSPEWVALPWQVRLIGDTLLEFWRGGTPEVWPKQETLAEILGKSRRTVKRWLAMAEAAGMIRRAYRPRAQGGRVYEISALVGLRGIDAKARNRSRGANMVSCQRGQHGGPSHTEESIEENTRPAPVRAREEQPRPAGRPPDEDHRDPPETATARSAELSRRRDNLDCEQPEAAQGQNRGTKQPRDGAWAIGHLVGALASFGVTQDGAEGFVQALQARGCDEDEISRAAESCANRAAEEPGGIGRPNLWLLAWLAHYRPGELVVRRRDYSWPTAAERGGIPWQAPSPAAEHGAGGAVDLRAEAATAALDSASRGGVSGVRGAGRGVMAGWRGGARAAAQRVTQYYPGGGGRGPYSRGTDRYVTGAELAAMEAAP